MSYSSVEASLEKATEKFDLLSSRRERLIKESRDIISLSAKTIINVHTSHIAEAKKLSKQTKQRLEELREVAETDLVRYILTPEQEFVESSVILAVALGEEVPSQSELEVGPSSYVLGLLDAIGELKREVYDRIRQDKIGEAENLFSAMESLYVMLSPFAVYDNIVQGVKRKLDVARMLIEDTRATMTEEARRSEFMAAVNGLSKKMGLLPITTREESNAPRRKRSHHSGSSRQKDEEGEQEDPADGEENEET